VESLGVDHLVILTHWSGLPVESAVASIRLLSEEVIPVLRSVPAASGS
jgi:hypothetical protein